MKILFLTRRTWPQIGGVEKHIHGISIVLKKRGYKVKVISEDDIKYPRIKFLGLLLIWIWLFRNRRLIEDADVVHCHDVYIWYLPFRYLYPKKPVFTTIHGLEWDNPLNPVSLWQKRLAVRSSSASIGVGKFLEKYLKTKFDLITYGAVNKVHGGFRKENKTVYVGRLEENTGLNKFLATINGETVDFIGDGELRNKCEKYGLVHGFTDPIPFYKNAQYCVSGGYLAALEALSYGCELKLFWNNKVKEDYWKMSPFTQRDVKSWAKEQTWKKLANEYLDLYNNAK